MISRAYWHQHNLSGLLEELPTTVKCTLLHLSDSDFKARWSEMTLVISDKEGYRFLLLIQH